MNVEALGILDIEFQSEKEREILISDLITFYEMIEEALYQETYQPLITLEDPKTLKTFEEIKTAVGHWARGYILGVDLDIDRWLQESPEEMSTFLFPIMSFVASDELLQEELKANHSEQTPDDIRRIGWKVLPELVKGNYRYWLAEQHEAALAEHVAEPTEKIGRNYLCPCGSGKKYKKCCLDVMIQ